MRAPRTSAAISPLVCPECIDGGLGLGITMVGVTVGSIVADGRGGETKGVVLVLSAPQHQWAKGQPTYLLSEIDTMTESISRCVVILDSTNAMESVVTISSGRPMMEMNSSELLSSDLTVTTGLVILDTVTFAMAVEDCDVFTKRARANKGFSISTRRLFLFVIEHCGHCAPLTDKNNCGINPPLPSVGPDVVVSVPPEASCAAMMRLRRIGIEVRVRCMSRDSIELYAPCAIASLDLGLGASRRKSQSARRGTVDDLRSGVLEGDVDVRLDVCGAEQDSEERP